MPYPGPHLPVVVREMAADDVHCGFLDCLEGLAPVVLSPEDALFHFIRRWESGCYVTLVALAVPMGRMGTDGRLFLAADERRVVGTATVLLEQKYIHGGGVAAHVEDVAVLPAYRGRGVGRELVLASLRVARERGCYKAVLNCSEYNVAFYEKCGFRRAPDGFLRADLKE